MCCSRDLKIIPAPEKISNPTPRILPDFSVRCSLTLGEIVGVLQATGTP